MKKSHLTIGFALLVAIFILVLIQTYNTLSIPGTSYLNKDKQLASVSVSTWDILKCRVAYDLCSILKSEEYQKTVCHPAYLKCLKAAGYEIQVPTQPKQIPPITLPSKNQPKP